MTKYPLDKSQWQRGPWDTEIATDVDAWDLPNGLHAVIRRNPVGSWCGYVGLPPDHPWFGRGYDTKLVPTKQMLEAKVDANEQSIISLFCSALSDDNPKEGIRMDVAVRVHGGVTFADTIPVEHMGKEGWWYIGFDCAHSGDMSPAMTQYSFHFRAMNEVYRTEAFVRGEVVHLFEELLNLPSPCVEISCLTSLHKPT